MSGRRDRTIRSSWLSCALAMAMSQNSALASDAIPIEDLARLPALQSVTMTPDGKHLVGLIPSPTNKDDTALATWNTDSLSAPTIATPSGEHMKFIFASALKADKILVAAQQKWTGQLSGCGEGKAVGATELRTTPTAAR